MKTHMIKVEVEFALTSEMVDQILVTAFDAAYGGSNYWAELKDLKTETLDGDSRWTQVTVIEKEDGQLHFIDAERIAFGLKKYIEDDQISESHLAETINSQATDFDANDADVIIQLAVFGEVTYG